MKIKVYPFNLVGNGSQVIPAVGSIVKVRTSTGDVNLSMDDIGPVGPFAAGQGVDLNRAGLSITEFKRVVITDASGAANAGTILIADAAFLDQTLSGVVSVVDGGKARTLAGSAFLSAVLTGAGAGQVPVVQLWNPNASGKNLILKAFTVGSGAAQSLVGGYHNAALAVGPASLSPKMLGSSAASVAQVRSDVPAAPFNATLPSFGLFIGASQSIPVTMQEPIVIPPNRGWVVYGQTAATSVQAMFEWFEEAA